MAPVDGKPFLQYMLEWLSRFDISHVVLSVGYLKEVIFNYIESRKWPFDISFAVEDEPLGTGGGIRLALSKCQGDHVFVLNGDTFFNVDLDRLPFLAPVTLALKPMRYFDRYGAVDWDGDLVTGFREKQACKEGYINGGVYAVDRSQLDLGLYPKRFSFEKEVLEPLAELSLVAGRLMDGYFIDIGIPEDYARAQRELPEIQAVLETSDSVVASGADTLLLDRDGVINRWLPEDYVDSWDKFTFLPGILECLREWAGCFRHIFVVTNQRGVGRGRIKEAVLAEIHRRMLEEIVKSGGRIDGVFVCTALSEEDPRRKPNTGMFREIMQLFPDVLPEHCVMVGDADSDREFADHCRVGFVRMETGEISLRFREAASSDS